jgi:hypothetical protein
MPSLTWAEFGEVLLVALPVASATAAVVLSLRLHALRARPKGKAGGPGLRLWFLGLPNDTATASPATPRGIFAAAMDLGTPNGWSTVMSTVDGDASIYLSSGGAFLGGEHFDQVQNAARAFVKAADGCFLSLAPLSPQPLPPAGSVRFYVHSRAGLLGSAEIARAEVEVQDHALLPCYRAAMEVINQVRLVFTSRRRPA